MTKYVALLRGINVGGNNIIKMADLKACFEKNGLINVTTFIQSGNVIFDSPITNPAELEKNIEQFLSATFKYKSTVLIRSASQIKKTLSAVPSDWRTSNDLRCYLAFLKAPLTSDQAIKEIETKTGIDFLKTGQGVIYMSTLLSGITKSKINKIIGKKIYQSITIRNYSTTQKIAKLMVSL